MPKQIQKLDSGVLKLLSLFGYHSRDPIVFSIYIPMRQKTMRFAFAL